MVAIAEDGFNRSDITRVVYTSPVSKHEFPEFRFFFQFQRRFCFLGVNLRIALDKNISGLFQSRKSVPVGYSLADRHYCLRS